MRQIARGNAANLPHFEEEDGDRKKASIVIYPSKEWRSRLCLRKQALKGPPFFAGGYRRVSYIAAMLGEKAGEIPALESSNGLVFSLAQRIGSRRCIAGRGR